MIPQSYILLLSSMNYFQEVSVQKAFRCWNEMIYVACGSSLNFNHIADFFFFFCAEIKKYEEQYHVIEIPNEESVVTYFKIRQQLAKLGKEIQEFIHKPKYCLPFLQPGRLVKVELHTLPVCDNNYGFAQVI